MTDAFVVPRGVTGFNIDDTDHGRLARRTQFVEWARVLGDTVSSTTTLVETGTRFDTVCFDRLGLWLVHNAWVPLIGAVDHHPKPGFAYAVDTTFVDIAHVVAAAPHLSAWGPEIVPADDLNRPLTDTDWATFTSPARAHADRYKPTLVRHLLFNFWD